ncbi:hypothetical protein [Rhodoblastus sp.]|uniref:hypothetical protein n=1 Tax=Rhodoblastus sp. TaxID=1962975 RepID=UPI0035B42246
MRNIDVSKIVPLDSMHGEDAEETEQLNALFQEAKAYLESFNWCYKVVAAYFGLGFANLIGIFLFEIIPTSKSVDSLVWVVVGDIPPAYLVVDNAPNPACALDAYIGEMSKWVNAVEAGLPVDNLIPVNVATTKENASRLHKRLQFLDREIVALYKDDLIE